jgi:hypothetical protein
VLAEERRAVAEAPRRLGEVYRRRRQRRGVGQTGILGVAEQAGGADMNILERLLQ